MSKQAILGAVLLPLALALDVARAAEDSPSDASGTSQGHAQPELCVQIISGPTPLDGASIRSAIEKELGLATNAVETPASVGTVRVQSGHGSLVTVSYESADGGTQLQRRIALPVSPARRPTVIAWIVGNLVRNEADEILLALLNRRATQDVEDESAEISEHEPREAAPLQSEATAANAVTQPSKLPATSAGRRPAVTEARASDLGTPRLFHVAFFSPLAYPRDAASLAFHLSFGGFYGHVGGVDGVGLGLLVDRIDVRSRGVQISGLWIDDNEHDGVLIAGAAARGRGSLRGAEVAGLVTWRAGCVVGAQVAGVWASTSGVCGLARDATGKSKSGLRGVQVAGIGTYVDYDVQGTQIAGAVNIANGRSDGLQLSGAFNYHRLPAAGAQIAGAVNVAGDIDGLQLGVVNVARDVAGLQLGVVNVARKSRGVQLGLFNWSEAARIQTIVFYQNPAYLNAGYRTISGHSTGTISLGYDSSAERMRTRFATGPHFAVDRFAFGAEFGYGWVLQHTPGKLSDRAHELELVGLASVQVVPNFVSVYGGGGVVLPVAGMVAIEPHGIGQVGLALF